jgi:hypothetical protein
MEILNKLKDLGAADIADAKIKLNLPVDYLRGIKIVSPGSVLLDWLLIL